MSMLQLWKEQEGKICLKIKERQEHNIELGELPHFLARVRHHINKEEMYVATR